MTAIMDPPAKAPPAAATEFREIPLEQLHESPKNPRTHYEPLALQQLADNLKAVGQITPVVVRPRRKGGGYELAAGHRRLRAARLAGLVALNAVVRDLDEAQFVEILNIENLQRDDLNALEEAQGFVTLMKDAGYDVPKIAARVGRSIKYVYDRVKLLQLIPAAKKLLEAGTLTAGHGILLARLSKDDQERALDADASFRGGGALQREHISGSYFFGEKIDDDEPPRKARSVRELAQWIDRNVRFDPAKVDQADLAFDFPQTAALLGAAATDKKLKVVKITREYRVPDEARDEKERTYWENGWKRADGEPEPVGRFGVEKDPKPSKTCDYSRPGLIVAGPGRGDAFLVCVNKEKCEVHWGKEIKERAARVKERERGAAKNGAASPAAKAAKPDPNLLPAELREKWTTEILAALAPEIAKGVKGVIGELKISDEICWNLAVDIQFWRWNKVGKRDHSGQRGTDHQDELEPLLSKLLPGKFYPNSLTGTDGPGARTDIAYRIWLARDCDIDEGIEKELDRRWAAERNAVAKAPAAVQTSGKAKKRAGDVARAKRAKKAKAAQGRAK